MMVAEAQGKEKVKGCVLFNAAGGLTSFRDEELPWVLRPLWVFVRVVLFGDIFGPGLFKRFATEENVRSVLSQVKAEGQIGRRTREGNEEKIVCGACCVFVCASAAQRVSTAVPSLIQLTETFLVGSGAIVSLWAHILTLHLSLAFQPSLRSTGTKPQSTTN